MALENEKYDSIHSETGSDLDAIKAKFDNGEHTNLLKYGPEAALMYQMQKMQDEMTYLRTIIDANQSSGGGTPTTQQQTLALNFYDNIGTTRHFLPFKDVNEQTYQYQDESAMVMPHNGKILSITVRVPSIINSGNLTVGVHQLGPDVNQFVTSSWTQEETETLPFTGTDDYHVFHFAFSNAKHFNAGDLVALSIQSSVDPSSSYLYYWVSAVVEYDISSYLGTTSKELPVTKGK